MTRGPLGVSDLQYSRLMETLSILAGERGNANFRAVRWNDLFAHPEVNRLSEQQQVIIGDLNEVVAPETGSMAVLAAALADAEADIQATEALANSALQAANAAQDDIQTEIASVNAQINDVLSLANTAQSEVDQLEQDLADQVQGLRDEYLPLLELRHSGEIDAQESIDTIWETLQSIQTRLADTNQKLTDAGLIIDPGTGLARLYAFEVLENQFNDLSVSLDAANAEIELRATQAYVSQAISEAILDPSQVPIINDLQLDVTDLQIAMSAAEDAINLRATILSVNGLTGRVEVNESDIGILQGQIALKVDTATFTPLETRVTDAETTLSTIEGAGIVSLVSDVRGYAEDATELQEQTLSQLLNAYENRELFRVDLAYARQDLTALVTEAREAEAQARTELGVRIDDNVTLITTEQTARADADSALAEDIATLQARTSGAEADILALNTVEVASSSALVQALLGLDAVVTDPGTGLAAAHGAINQLNNVDVGSTSALVQALLALEGTVTDPGTGLAAAHGFISQLNNVDVGSTSALVQDYLNLKGTVTDPGTGLAAAHGEIDELNNVNVGSTSALVQAHLGLEATVTDPGTGLAAAHGEIDELNNVNVGSTSALVQAHLGLDGQVNDPGTGLAAAHGEIDELNSVNVSSTSALVQDYLSLKATVNDPGTGLAAAHGEIDQLNNVNVGSTSALVQSYLGLAATVNDPSTGLAAAHGEIDELNNVNVGSTSALVSSHLALDTRVGDTESEIQQLNTVNSGSTSALVLAFLGLQSSVTDPLTGLAAAHGEIDDIKALDIDAGSVLATTLTSLEASVSYADDANPSFYSLLLDTDSFTGFGTAVTASPGPAGLGQTGTVDLTDTQVAIDTAGATNGAYIWIPEIKASHFNGQRIRIDVMARYPGVGSPPTIGITCSTGIVGNSGLLTPDTALTSSHAWYSVYYDVPASNTGGIYVAIFPDAASGGETINVSRVAVRVAALADEIPGIGINSATIDDILTLSVDAGTALAQHTTQVTSTLFPEGGTPLETRVSTTEQSVDGVLGLWGVQVNNNGHISGLALVSDLIDGNPVSNFAVAADVFRVVSPGGSEQAAPFIVYTTPTQVNGETVQPGVYLNSATLHNAFITAAMIVDAAITRAQIADAAIGAAQIEDAVITTAKLAGTLQSTNYSADVAGWRITMAGDAEFNSLVVREGNIQDGAVTETDDVTNTWAGDGTALNFGSRVLLAELTFADNIDGVVDIYTQVTLHFGTGGGDAILTITKDGADIASNTFDLAAFGDIPVQLIGFSDSGGVFRLYGEEASSSTFFASVKSAKLVARRNKK